MTALLNRSLLALILLLATTAVHAAADFLVDAEWLEQHIKDPKLVVLEVRYYPHRYYTIGHIPGAVQVQRFKDLGDNFGNPTMRFPSRDAIQTTLRGWGVNNDSTLVLYDDSLTALAFAPLLSTRSIWLRHDAGEDSERRDHRLDGIQRAVEGAGQRLRGNVTLKPANRKLLVEWTDVYSDVVARRDPGIVLLDARPHDMYTGKLVQHSIQGGHIPGAISIVSLDGADGQSQTWKTAWTKSVRCITTSPGTRPCTPTATTAFAPRSPGCN